MTLNGVKSGDIVLCDRMGRVFYATVIDRHERELEVEPIDRRVDVPPRQGPRGDRHLAQEPRPERPRPRDAEARVMTDTNGHRVSAEELVVVHVKDTINVALAGRGDLSYQSPPLPQAEAQTLVRLLLGRGEEPPTDHSRWSCPIAGGQRTVTIRSSVDDPRPNRTSG